MGKIAFVSDLVSQIFRVGIRSRISLAQTLVPRDGVSLG